MEECVPEGVSGIGWITRVCEFAITVRSTLFVKAAKGDNMADPTNVRQERIEKLLYELRYEVERGMLEKEIGEEMGFRFYVPISSKMPDGVVFCEFRTRPIARVMMHPDDLQPRLRLVK